MRRANGLDPRRAHVVEFDPGWQSTDELPVADRLIDQVIGQERAVEIIRIAARQRRFVLLIGETGTGKSMLAQAMAQMLPAEGLEEQLLAQGSAPRFAMRNRLDA